MKTVHIECRQYDEWDEKTQQTILEKHYDINTDHEWWDFVYEDAKRIGALMGIEIDKIFFSGFSSQGDGAQFTGSYSYAKGCAAKVKAEAPTDEELHRISSELQKLQSRYFYGLTAHISSEGNYSHEYCTSIRVYKNDDYDEYADADVDDALTTLLRDVMRWIYQQLEKEYYWQTDVQQITETLKANEYEFDCNGTIR